MLTKPKPIPFPEARQKLDDALWQYYELCFPQYDEGERYDLSRDVLVAVDDAVRQHYKESAQRSHAKGFVFDWSKLPPQFNDWQWASVDADGTIRIHEGEPRTNGTVWINKQWAFYSHFSTDDDGPWHYVIPPGVDWRTLKQRRPQKGKDE